jgi:hypothetical protein
MAGPPDFSSSRIVLKDDKLPHASVDIQYVEDETATKPHNIFAGPVALGTDPSGLPAIGKMLIFLGRLST